jgi:hypothetical protein
VPGLGQQLKQRAAEIAFPRAAGSPGNERARAIVRRHFEAAGLAVEEQPFSYDLEIAFRVIRWTLRACAAAVAAAALLAAGHPAIAAATLAAGVLGGVLLIGWAPGAERLYAAGGPTKTANVIARRAAAAVRRKTLILLAHYDSKSQNLTFPWRMASTLLAILGVAGLAVSLALGSATGAQVCGGVAAIALAALSTLRNENRSPGGTDNAGSVAILLELARTLPAAVPEDVELILLSPSAEEDHMVGAMRWLSEKLGAETSTGAEVVAINLDGAGIPGRAVAMQWFGFGRRFGPGIIRSAREASAALVIPMRRIWLPPAVGVDAIPFVHRGIECVTFASGSLGRATMAVHSAGDVAENLCAESLERVYRLVHETARRLAA